MRFYLIILLLCGFVFGPAHAGAWMRKKGSSFTALSFALDRSHQISRTSYFEYGWSEKLTFGSQISTGPDGAGVPTGDAVVFMRKPMLQGDGPHNFAYELGAGITWVGQTIAPRFQAGLSWGRGIELKKKSGWVAVDATVIRPGLDSSQIKIDSTIGLNFTKVTSGMMQLYLNYQKEANLTVSPSVMFSGKKGKFRLQLGAEMNLGSRGDSTLKMGFWQEF